jgi:hypothetical protein
MCSVEVTCQEFSRIIYTLSIYLCDQFKGNEMSRAYSTHDWFGIAYKFVIGKPDYTALFERFRCCRQLRERGSVLWTSQWNFWCHKWWQIPSLSLAVPLSVSQEFFRCVEMCNYYLLKLFQRLCIRCFIADIKLSSRKITNGGNSETKLLPSVS